MAAICRLLARKQILGGLRNEPLLYQALRPVTIQAKPYKAPEELTIHEKAVKLKRPQSPHLTIYAPQLTSMMSITHRMTGMALWGYSLILGSAALATSPGTIPQFIDTLHTVPLAIPALKFILAVPFSYHFVNGIRHLLWDAGKCLTIKEVYSTGYAVLIATVIGTAALMAM